MTKTNLFRGFRTSPEVIRLAVMMHVRFPLSLRNVEDFLHERGIDVCHESVRFFWYRFGPVFASEIRKRRIEGKHSSHWRWYLDEMFVKTNGERHYLWRAVDHKGEVLESYGTKTRDNEVAMKILKKSMKKHGGAKVFVTDKLRSYGAALKDLGVEDRQKTGRWLNNRAENSHLPFRRRERAMQRFRRLRSLQMFASCANLMVADQLPDILCNSMCHSPLQIVCPQSTATGFRPARDQPVRYVVSDLPCITPGVYRGQSVSSLVAEFSGERCNRPGAELPNSSFPTPRP